MASSRDHARRRAAALGMWWGLGQALTLVLFGVPILLFEAYLPGVVQRGAETAVAALIVFLAVRLLVRHRHRHAQGHAVRRPLGHDQLRRDSRHPSEHSSRGRASARLASLAFGLRYAAAVWGLMPYPF
jgi:hypothetical protein